MNGKTKLSCALPGLAVLLAGCGAQQYEFDPEWHLSQERVSQEEPVDPSGVPDLIGTTAALPELVYEGQADLFDISVENVSVRSVLLSLADQAQVNLDIDPRLDGPVSLNVYGQTLSEILDRISRQLPMRFERIGETLVVLRDDYYIKQYHLHYPDLTRTYTASFDGTAPSTGTGSTGSSSISSTKEGSGSVWTEIEDAISTVLAALDLTYISGGTAPPPTSDDVTGIQENEVVSALTARVPIPSEQSFVYTLPDTGLIIVRGNSKQHELVGDIIEKVSTSARRQVLLQATVVEIVLNNQYQQGIDWSIFAANDSPKVVQSEGVSYGPILAGPGLEAIEEYRALVSAFTSDEDEINTLVRAFAESSPRFVPTGSATGGFLDASFTVGDVDLALSLLDKFGDTRVVSSPRISTLNGQGAILKVVTDEVYFEVEVTRERDDAGVVTETVAVTRNELPVGFVVNVYPQIGNDGTIILSMRPSVSRVIGTALQPTVGTNNLIQTSAVPIVSVKEIETLMMLNDGQTAVMGGLIEDQLTDNDTKVPGAGDIPGLGSLFTNTSQRTQRVEYVIFVSAKIINNPSLHGDYSDYRDMLPSEETFRRDQTETFFNRPVLDTPRSQ